MANTAAWASRTPAPPPCARSSPADGLLVSQLGPVSPAGPAPAGPITSSRPPAMAQAPSTQNPRAPPAPSVSVSRSRAPAGSVASRCRNVASPDCSPTQRATKAAASAPAISPAIPSGPCSAHREQIAEHAGHYAAGQADQAERCVRRDERVRLRVEQGSPPPGRSSPAKRGAPPPPRTTRRPRRAARSRRRPRATRRPRPRRCASAGQARPGHRGRVRAGELAQTWSAAAYATPQRPTGRGWRNSSHPGRSPPGRLATVWLAFFSHASAALGVSSSGHPKPARGEGIT